MVGSGTWPRIAVGEDETPSIEAEFTYGGDGAVVVGMSIMSPGSSACDGDECWDMPSRPPS